jgi:hypothetical protein
MIMQRMPRDTFEAGVFGAWIWIALAEDVAWEWAVVTVIGYSMDGAN